MVLATGIMGVFLLVAACILPIMSASYIMSTAMLGGTVLGAVTIYTGLLIATKSEVAEMVIKAMKSIISKRGRNHSA